MTPITFEIAVSRRHKNKDGRGQPGFNNSFYNERLDTDSLIATLTAGWPVTMAHTHAAPGPEARARGVSTARHAENFTSQQVIFLDDDRKAPGVVDYWLHDSFFSQWGAFFYESANSKPGAEKGRPVFVLDGAITCPKLLKEIQKALMWRYPHVDQSTHDVTRIWYGAEGSKAHKIGAILPFAVLEREVLSPYREHLAQQAAIEEAYQRRRLAEIEQARAEGRIRSDAGAFENYLANTLDGIFKFVASQAHTRHKVIYWAGVKVGELQSAAWTAAFSHLLADVDYRIVDAARINGYLATYAHDNEAEVLRTFNDGRRLGAAHPAAQPELYERAKPSQPTQPGPKELERRALAEKYRAEAQAAPQLTTLKFEHALPPAELDKCELTLEHTVWASEGGRGQTFYYCNDPARCALCRERFTLKLGYHLDDAARLAYVDADGNAAWSKPELTEAGEFFSATRGPGQWYGIILEEGERRNFRARYKREKPGGFIKPEVYAVPDGYETKFVALSLAPFEDMQPVHLTDDLLQRIAVGVPHTRASLLFAPPRKQLERALPRYTFEIPQYLNERGIVATVPAAHSVLFTGPIKSEDIYSSFSTRAETFDDIGLILEEVAEKSIDSDRLRGEDDHAPDYVIQSICIVPEAKPAYLAVWNAGREADIATIKKFKRSGLPPLPTLQSGRVVKGIYVSKLYMPLTTRQADFDGGPPEGTPAFYAHRERLLQNGAI